MDVIQGVGNLRQALQLVQLAQRHVVQGRARRALPIVDALIERLLQQVQQQKEGIVLSLFEGGNAVGGPTVDLNDMRMPQTTQ